MTFNRFANEINLDRFAKKYDAARGQFASYADVGRGPGKSKEKHKAPSTARVQAERLTFAKGQVTVHTNLEDPWREPAVADRNRLMPTYAELLEAAEKLEAYVRRLDGLDAERAGLPDVKLGVNYSQAQPLSKDKGGDGRNVTSCWRMPIEQLTVRIDKQRALVAKWETRLLETTDSRKRAAARARVKQTTDKLNSAIAILNERLKTQETE